MRTRVQLLLAIMQKRFSPAQVLTMATGTNGDAREFWCPARRDLIWID